MTAVALSLGVLGLTAPAQEGPTLDVTLAAARFDTHPRTGARRDALRVDARLVPADPVRDFDPLVDALRVTVAGVPVLDVAPPYAQGALRAWRRRGTVRRWRYLERGAAGTIGRREFRADTATGKIRLTVTRADLTALRDAGPGDVDVALTVGSVTASDRFSFVVRHATAPIRWQYRPTPPTPGPLVFTSLVAGSLANTPRPESEVISDAQRLAEVWTALGNPSALPQVDFDQEMVIVVSGLVTGPGMSPPMLNVISARSTGTGVAIDWRLGLCEEPNQCPGAPGVPCPTATPFHAIRVAKTAGPVTLAQRDTVWVCP